MLPVYSDPDVLERIYNHFAYLCGAPVTLRGFGDYTCLSSATLGVWLILLLAKPDTSLPYTPRHIGLSHEQNALLTTSRTSHRSWCGLSLFSASSRTLTQARA